MAEKSGNSPIPSEGPPWSARPETEVVTSPAFTEYSDRDPNTSLASSIFDSSALDTSSIRQVPSSDPVSEDDPTPSRSSDDETFHAVVNRFELSTEDHQRLIERQNAEEDDTVLAPSPRKASSPAGEQPPRAPSNDKPESGVPDAILESGVVLLFSRETSSTAGYNMKEWSCQSSESGIPISLPMLSTLNEVGLADVPETLVFQLAVFLEENEREFRDSVVAAIYKVPMKGKVGKRGEHRMYILMMPKQGGHGREKEDPLKTVKEAKELKKAQAFDGAKIKQEE